MAMKSTRKKQARIRAPKGKQVIETLLRGGPVKGITTAEWLQLTREDGSTRD
jgi:hypothetical protein